MKTSVTAAVAAILPVLALSAAPAKAEVLANAKSPNLCLDVNQANNQVIMWGCHGAANQNFFTSAYGQQRFNGLCLDFEGAAGTQRGANLMMRGCDPNKRSQRWTLVNDNSAPGALRNEEGWCADVFQGNVVQGQKIVAWDCKWGIDITRDNQTFIRGRFGAAGAMGAPQLQNLPPGARLVNGSNIVAAGAGNIVAAGGGNIVAAGGGNIVAAGGGNVIAATGGGIVAAGGGN